MTGCNCTRSKDRNTAKNMLLLFHKQWFLRFVWLQLFIFTPKIETEIFKIFIYALI